MLKRKRRNRNDLSRLTDLNLVEINVADSRNKLKTTKVICSCDTNKRETTKRTVLFLFISSYLFLEFVWSVGTTNWGTAARHHVPAMGIMLLMGFMFKDHIGQFKEPLK